MHVQKKYLSKKKEMLTKKTWLALFVKRFGNRVK